LRFSLLSVYMLLLPPATQAATPLLLQPHDRIAIVGNGLADRMQHDPWVETVLQSHFKGLHVKFRNMSSSGDRVNRKPRSKGFTNDTEYLQHVNPDIVFLFYGYNESFDGEAGAANYQQELIKIVNRYRALLKKQNRDATFVLFSPIAYENTGDPNLPDGKELNANLAIYTEATHQAAKQAQARFVDLFSPTRRLFESSEQRFTINGIHLNALGYQHLAEIISQNLLGKPAPPRNALAELYAAVKDKNWYWHNRYRATDGNDIWGSRSVLTFVDRQSNAEVLRHELEMLDVMTDNRDHVIWAAAQGKRIAPDDSNVPPPIHVKSNVGGLSESSSKSKEGSMHYLSPEASLAKIKTPDDFELNVFASEVQFPDLANPVQLQVDAKGRLWAASWNSYPKWEPLKEMKDSLMIFEDTDHDGVADQRTIFAHVHNPLGFEFWGGGVLVTSGPDLLFLKDTDGDDKADVRYPILQGLGTSDTHHAANNLIFGPDGGIYWQSGVFLKHNHETPWQKNLEIGQSGMYRFDPRTFAITPIAANGPNPHGASFDYWGYCYANDGTSGKSYQVRPEKNGFKMHLLLKKEFRPVPANAILSSAHFPADMQNDFLICNVIGFLGVKQYDLDRDGDQKRRSLGEVWGTPVQALLQSQDSNFRPSDAAVGEDGALYVADWHNMIIGHMQHNIRDPNRDHQHGRILRLTAKGRPLQEPVPIHGQPIETLLDNLKHPIDGVRHRTRVELSGRNSTEVIAAAQQWIKGFDPNDEAEAHHLLEALWLHQQHHVKNQPLLNTLLNSKIEHAVVAARTVKHLWENVDLKHANRFVAPAETDFVRYNAPEHLSPADKEIYLQGAKIFQQESHCATCHQTHGKGNGTVYPSLVDSPWVTGSEERLIKLALHGLWGKMTVHGKTYDPTRGVPPMTAFRDLLRDEQLAAVLTFVRNTWGNKASPIREATVQRVREETADRTTFWKPDELLAEHPLEQELMSEDFVAPQELANIELESALLSESPADLAQAAIDQGDAARGKQLFYKSSAACFACHDPPAGAPLVGPDLTKINTKIAPADLVDSVLRPSKLIQQEFSQVNVQTADGLIITGIRISENEQEIVIRNLAEPHPITLAKEDVEGVFDVDTSIMPDKLVQQLKSRQEFYDLMKYVLETRKR
jgi:putative heme-binding domain-containing protein